jgi:hypothetical protein
MCVCVYVCMYVYVYTRAICKVRGLTLVFRVGTLWRCDDGLFFEVRPLASDVLLTTLHATGLYGGCSNGVLPIHFFQAERRIQFRSRLVRVLSFSNHEKGAPRQEISKCSTVCRAFSRIGWSVVRSTSLAKGRTSKKRPSSHLHKVPTRSNESTNFSNVPHIYIYVCVCVCVCV